MPLRVIAVNVGMAIIFAGCGSGDGGPGAQNPTQTEASPPESPVDEGLALEGVWVTDPLSKPDAEKTLRQNGLAKWIDRFRPVSPIADDTVLVLEIGEQWDLYRQVKGGFHGRKLITTPTTSSRSTTSKWSTQLGQTRSVGPWMATRSGSFG